MRAGAAGPRGRWLGGVGLALLLGGLAACRTTRSSGGATERPPAAVVRVRVCHLAVPDAFGTAVPVGGRRLATCRHVLAKGRRWVRLNGRPMLIRRVGGGCDETDAEDWAVFEVPDRAAVAQPLPVAFDRPVKRGEVIYLVGYGWQRGVWPHELVIHIIRGTVRSARKGGRVLLVDTPDDEIYAGMSGGAAVAYDAGTDRAEIVGLYRGWIEWTFLGLRVGGAHVCVRPPLGGESCPPH